jgi:hypothetical protein
MNEETQRDIRHMQWAPLLVCESPGYPPAVQGVQKVLSSTGGQNGPGSDTSNILRNVI